MHLLTRGPLIVLAVTALHIGVPATGASGWQTQDGAYPKRVLITNDNGIDDPKIIALARAFSRHSETWVVAPSTDRSGTSNYLSIAANGSVSVHAVDMGPEIRAYAVDGYPADCVLVGALGLMADGPPDLVISGINGGENFGADWMFSGTVGAARVAAFGGVPAIAVSGLDDDIPGAVTAAVDWVVRLAASDLIRQLRPMEYVTVSMPRTSPESIRGVRLTDRAPVRRVPVIASDGSGAWAIVGQDTLGEAPEWSDEAAVAAGYIAVVPMRADEVDVRRLSEWRREAPGLPAWQR
jgi:5'-nucleotidase